MENNRIKSYVSKLESVKKNIQTKLQEDDLIVSGTKKISGVEFENIVYDALIDAGIKDDEITHSSQRFPDFVLKNNITGEKIGIEVKKTDTNKWEVIGGSIYESIKKDESDTYLLMAKFGGNNPEVRLKKYENCIADLKVTHSPRFYLNLDLEEGEDYLTKNDANDLLKLSEIELNKKIRELLRTQKSTWWSEAETISFSNLSKEEKDSYLNDGIALFPEVLQGDYQKFTPWLVYSCLVWCGNVRDIFSAGGNKYVEKLDIYVSAIMFRVLENINNIKGRILDMTEEEQNKFWGGIYGTENEKIVAWIELIERNLEFSAVLIKNNRKIDKYARYSDEKLVLMIKNKFINEVTDKMKKK